MRRLLVALYLAFALIGCGGGDNTNELGKVEVVEEEQPDEPQFVNKYYWPFQCPDEADMQAFYKAIERDGGRYPAREIPQGTVVYLTEDTEDFRTAVGMCVEALNWALPDEYDLIFSEQTVPSGDYRQKPPPHGEIYVDLNQELIEWYWEHHHPLAEALAYPNYIAIGEDTFTGNHLYRAHTICHELMHVLGFWGHPSRSGEIYSILGAPDGCNVGASTEDGVMIGKYNQDYKHRVECLGIDITKWPPNELVRYQSTFGPNTLLTPIDAMALRKLYGGNDVEEWATEEGLYPADCPEK